MDTANRRCISPNHASTPKATVSPSVPDIAWASGFLEGEGCFTPHRPSNGRIYARVMAVQKTLEPLEKLKAFFGGTITRRKRQDAFNWSVSGPRARGVMMTIFTFMSLRRRAAIREVLMQGVN